MLLKVVKYCCTKGVVFKLCNITTIFAHTNQIESKTLVQMFVLSLQKPTRLILGQKKLTLIVTEKLRYATKIFYFLKFVQNREKYKQHKQMFGCYRQTKRLMRSCISLFSIFYSHSLNFRFFVSVTIS